MKTSVELSIMARVDNMGSISMAGSITATSHTKHVDIRYRYVNEYVADDIAKIVFVQSVKNDANTLT